MPATRRGTFNPSIVPAGWRDIGYVVNESCNISSSIFLTSFCMHVAFSDSGLPCVLIGLCCREFLFCMVGDRRSRGCNSSRTTASVLLIAPPSGTSAGRPFYHFIPYQLDLLGVQARLLRAGRFTSWAAVSLSRTISFFKWRFTSLVGPMGRDRKVASCRVARRLCVALLAFLKRSVWVTS